MQKAGHLKLFALVALTLCLLATIASARDLFPIRKGGKYGYIDSAGTVVIEPQWDEAGYFSDGLAAFRMFSDSLIGFLDTTGAVVIWPAFGENVFGLPRFSEGLACVSRPHRDRYGYIDTTGKMVIADSLLFATDFSDGLAEASRVNHFMHGCINKLGKFAVPQRFPMIGEFHDGVAFAVVDTSYKTKVLIDRTGTIILGPTDEELGMPSEGFVTLGKIQESGDVTVSFINFTGQSATLGPFLADISRLESLRFSEGLAGLSGWTEEGAFRYGFMNRHGDTVVAPTYAAIECFREGLASVEIDSGEEIYFAYIDTSGRVVIPPDLEGMRIVTPGYFSHGLAQIVLADSKEVDYSAYINRQGKIVWLAPAE